MLLGKSGLFTWLVPVTLAVVLGLTLPEYWVYIMTAVIISTLIARSVGFVTIQAGLISLCQMSFAAMGGWTVSWLALSLPGVSFPLLVAIGGLVAMPIGWLLGLMTARIRGVELAVLTLGFAAALDLVLRQGSFPGVATGTPVSPAAPLDDPRWFFLFALTLIIILQAGVVILSRSRLSLGWAAMRESEKSAAAMGLRVETLKASAFAMGALFAGLAGGLLSAQYGLLTAAAFSPVISMGYLATAVLSGASFFGGAVLAGIVTILVPEILGRLGLPLILGPGLLALGAFDVLRRGNGGLIEQLNRGLQDHRFRDARRTCRPPLEVTSVNETPLSLAPVLEVRELSIEIAHNPILTSINLTVSELEVHALIGPNGAGKTMLIDAVSGFFSHYEGTVLLQGTAIDRMRAHTRARSGIRRTFQETQSIEALTIDEFLRVSAGPADRERTKEVREFFGLPEGHLPIRFLDAGSRRVLEVAGTVISRPRIILLDEPASGLSELESISLAHCIRAIPSRFNCSVLLVEHDIGFVKMAASRATALNEGRIISSGFVTDVLANSDVTSSYLGKKTTS